MRDLEQIIASNNTAAIDLAAAAARHDRYARALKQIVNSIDRVLDLDGPGTTVLATANALRELRDKAAEALGI